MGRLRPGPPRSEVGDTRTHKGLTCSVAPERYSYSSGNVGRLGVGSSGKEGLGVRGGNSACYFRARVGARRGGAASLSEWGCCVPRLRFKCSARRRRRVRTPVGPAARGIPGGGHAGPDRLVAVSGGRFRVRAEAAAQEQPGREAQRRRARRLRARGLVYECGDGGRGPQRVGVTPGV